MSEDSTDSSNITSNTGLFIGVWLLALGLFLFFPCMVSKRLRRRWCKRLKERRWNVDVDSELDESSWYIFARARYEAARARAAADLDDVANRLNGNNSRLSKEEKEAIRQEFLLKQLSQYSITLKDEDFKQNADAKRTIRNQITVAEPDDDNVDLESGKQTNLEGTADDLDTVPSNVFEECDTVVTILPGGMCIAAAASTDDAQADRLTREVPNGCAICLSSFSSGEVITWAANEHCPHAFHNECILNWLLSVGRKKRRHQQDSSDSDDDINNEALNFPMLCPCCRQQFVSIPAEVKKSASQNDTESVESAGNCLHSANSGRGERSTSQAETVPEDSRPSVLAGTIDVAATDAAPSLSLGDEPSQEVEPSTA